MVHDISQRSIRSRTENSVNSQILPCYWPKNGKSEGRPRKEVGRQKAEAGRQKPECGSEFLDIENLFGLPTLNYKPPSLTGVEDGPQPAALCACTVTVQFGIKSTAKYVVSVVPPTVCVNVPAPSLPVIVI